MTTLTDTVRIQAPERSPVSPASPLDPSWDNASETRSPKRLFEVRSGPDPLRSGTDQRWAVDSRSGEKQRDHPPRRGPPQRPNTI